MAKSTNESRIPVSRLSRPSLLPKTSKIRTAHRINKQRNNDIHVFNQHSDDLEINDAYPHCSLWTTQENMIADKFLHQSSDKIAVICSGLGNRDDSPGTASSSEGPHFLSLGNKQNSFEHSESSLGILTPDQMSDFTSNLEKSSSAAAAAAVNLAHAQQTFSNQKVTIVADRSPSLEDLPLDPNPKNDCAITTSTTASTGSFITSITSITSLEAGYQGDGENSRPASRGAESMSVAQPPVAPRRQDPMTDSDFFTESDADAHEEVVRGDRRAQVIDGKLFCIPSDRHCPSFTGEEMDSSGIFSDLDKRLDGPNEVENFGDEHTTDTGDTEISLKSQLTPEDKPVPAINSTNMLSPIANDTTFLSNEPSSPGLIDNTVIKCQIDDDPPETKPKVTNGCNKENMPLKKYKMPKRNVISKIKTMIESGQSQSKDNTENDVRKNHRSTKKNGKWEAVMNKIEAGKTRGRAFKKEVKSRVLQGLTPSSPTGSAASSTTVETSNTLNNKEKSKRLRIRQGINASHTARSSVRSSTSDLSSAYSKETSKRLPRKNLIDGHLQHNVNNHNSIKSNLSSARKTTIGIGPQNNNSKKHNNATANRVADNRRTLANGNSHNTINNNHINSKKDKKLLPEIDILSQVPLHEEPQKHHKSAQVNLADLNESKRLEDMALALAVTVQHFTLQHLDQASSNCKIKASFEELKTKFLSAQLELEKLRAREEDLQDALNQEREDHRKTKLDCTEKLENLREDLVKKQTELKHYADCIEGEKRRIEKQLAAEYQKEQKLALARLTAEHELHISRLQSELDSARTTRDHGSLLAEVESLRTVLEIRGQESLNLRSENDHLRRELDEKETLKQRFEAIEARCEDLDAQLKTKESLERQLSHENEILLGKNHQLIKQNKRLSQKNEELYWRLRRKNEVVNVLANQLTPTSNQRLSKSLDTEDVDQTIDYDASTATHKSDQSCSMMKFMVEKNDSVSWTLDINDSTMPELKINNSRKSVTNGSPVSRQGSLRLSAPKRPFPQNRARSNSASTDESAKEECRTGWNPSFQSTPIASRRNTSKESNWLMSSMNETASSPKISVDLVKGKDSSSFIPQEAGGEAMISEEASVSSSEDESSSSDIP